MEYLHYKVKTHSNSIIEVSLDKQANIKLMDNKNYQNYRMKKKYDFIGGLARVSPMVLKPPYKGEWHIVVDLEGMGGSVKAKVKVKEAT